MRDIKKIYKKDADIDITPMLDVVFILLIFFVVTASFTKQQGLAINHPDSAVSNGRPIQTIVVFIGADQSIKVNERRIGAQLLYANISRALAVNPNSEVVVKIAANAYTSNLIKTLDVLRKAKVLDPPVSLDI